MVMRLKGADKVFAKEPAMPPAIIVRYRPSTKSSFNVCSSVSDDKSDINKEMKKENEGFVRGLFVMTG